MKWKICWNPTFSSIFCLFICGLHADTVINYTPTAAVAWSSSSYIQHIVVTTTYHYSPTAAVAWILLHTTAARSCCCRHGILILYNIFNLSFKNSQTIRVHSLRELTTSRDQKIFKILQISRAYSLEGLQAFKVSNSFCFGNTKSWPYVSMQVHWTFESLTIKIVKTHVAKQNIGFII